MARSTKRQLERTNPEFAEANRVGKGDETTTMTMMDAVEEFGAAEDMGGGLMIRRFVVGQAYWMETAHWVYFGRCICVGLDYIELGEACRIPSDGRHSIMMATGTAPNIRIETTGGKHHKMVIPLDWIGPWCTWDFPIPTESI